MNFGKIIVSLYVLQGDPNALKQFVQTCRAFVTSLEKIRVDLQRHKQILVYDKETTRTAKIGMGEVHYQARVTYIQYRIMITASFYGRDPASTKERRNTLQSDKGTTVKLSFVTRDSSGPVCGHGNHLITDCKQFAGMGVCKSLHIH
ncbi:hypothetical protein ACLKA7_000130 [Drosophila subpalustris]